MERKINFPDSFAFAYRDDKVRFDVDVTKLTDDILVKLALHGLQQKLADAGSGAVMAACVAVVGNKAEGESKEAYLAKLRECAKTIPLDDVNKEAEGMSRKALDALLRGEWSSRVAGPTVDEELLSFVYARADVQALMARDVKEWAKMKKPARVAHLDGWLDAKDGRRARFAADLAKAKAEAAAIKLDDL